MHYPIFNSIVNTIDTQLNLRGISTSKFKTWEDNKINAIGLELIISLGKVSKYIQSISINFDWDSFRETELAQRLEGMENHPLLKFERLTKANIDPTIDIEMTWLFDIGCCQPKIPDLSGNYRLEMASKWMEAISKKVNTLLEEDNIITRWHIEIEGDETGKFLSAINLISYFQYTVTSPTTVNEVQKFVTERLNDLLYKANKVIYQSEEVLQNTIAA